MNEYHLEHYESPDGYHTNTPDQILMDMEEYDYVSQKETEQQKLLQILWNTLHFIMEFDTEHRVEVITTYLMKWKQHQSEYQEETEEQKLLQILWETLQFIKDFRTKHHNAVITGILIALYDPVTIPKSGREYGEEFGLSSNTISYYKRRFEKKVLYKKV